MLTGNCDHMLASNTSSSVDFKPFVRYYYHSNATSISSFSSVNKGLAVLLNSGILMASEFIYY
jgi:hypothetical protein